MTSIELLSPARNLECGMAAVDHGADAVYIGSPRYGARAAAGNSVDDIEQLCRYAHPYGVRIYVTLNTILYDDELHDTQQLIWQLYRAGVDALIVQDLALLEMDLPPIPLHASTQMDNRSADKVRWLQGLGFKQTVLARELSLEQIRHIHAEVPEMPLEAFVHGALCVSYSGQCFASQYCFGRSANRGECAQFCRLPFVLTDAHGSQLTPERHLLSLRDMNRMEYLEEMMDAGVSSFKIEGRLKDVSYVKNVTAAYRQALDKIIACRSSQYCRSSLGHSELTFHPDTQRSFSRGFTDYFLHGRQGSVASMDTPKSRGAEVGVVKGVSHDSIVVSGTASFANGDGLCFIDVQGHLCGFRVNKAVGNRLYPLSMPQVRRGDRLWRNYDQVWERLLAGRTANRSIGLEMSFSDVTDGFVLTLRREDGAEQTFHFPYVHQLARSSQEDGIRQVMSKTGDTVYACSRVDVSLSRPWFVPRSILAQWRRQALEAAFVQNDKSEVGQGGIGRSLLVADEAHCAGGAGSHVTEKPSMAVPQAFLGTTSTYRHNISNHLARRFYESQGITVGEMAMECGSVKRRECLLMTCRHCLRYEFGWCRRQGASSGNVTEPLYLNLADGRKFRLEFDCRQCEMKVWNA